MKYPRQKIHFTTPKGWCNDPNGLVYIDGTYHLFYQYYPNDTKWGPMHWGHATSRDLLTWQHLPVALFPDEREYCFSGSAVLDRENASGLGSIANPPLLLFYTAHNPASGQQTQCLAYSTDYVHFEKYSENPIVQNSSKKDFRDPKIVQNPAGSGWIMVIAAGKDIDFWKSDNLINWTYSGSFCPGDYAIGGICECPDLLDFGGTFGDPEKPCHVLTMSMIYWDKDGTEHNTMQYFTGRFDGITFTDVQPASSPLFLDYGDRNYAAVTFSGTKEHIMMGWAENWKEARQNDAEDWFGKMTFPRKVHLAYQSDSSAGLTGYFLRQTPVTNYPLPTENDMLWISRLSLEPGESFSKSGVNISVNENSLSINGKSIPRILKGTSKITVVFDTGLFEIFADDGFVCYSGQRL